MLLRTKYALLLLLNALFSVTVEAAAASWTQNYCSDVIVRKEWRTLTKSQQKNYLSAVQCFLKKPSITPHFNNSGVKSRYDDLVYTHILQTFSIHYVGDFLPWHRYFTAVYEHALRTECGYTGAQPYWDWTLDVDPMSKFDKSPIWDSVYGFGGNGPFVPDNTSDPFYVPGRTGGGCVTDGPFKDMTVHLGPDSSVTYNPQCLKRDFSPYFANWYLGSNQTKLTLQQENFGWFDRVVEGGPSFEASGVHGGGHYSVGGTFGQMGDLYASPCDPIFFLHHANLDRVWVSWQSYNLPHRLTDISGPIFLMDYNNVQGGNVTLKFPLSVGVSAPNVTIGEVMNIVGGGGEGRMCYVYDRLYEL